MALPRLTGPLAVLLVAVADLTCWLWLGTERAGLGRPGDLAALLTAVCAWVLQLALTWVLVLVALTAAEPYAGRELAGYAGCPARLRPVLLAVCGVAAVGAFAGPVHPPRPGAPALDRPASHTVQSTPAPSPSTTPPSTTPSPAASGPGRSPVPVARETSRTPARSVVVRPGDSLWAIAERHLPAPATDAQITAGWHRLYARNRARIGDDPDLLLPGTTLTMTRTAPRGLTAPQEDR